MSKYIEISLETTQGATNECWNLSCGSVSFAPPDPLNPGGLTHDTLGLVVSGYKDKTSQLNNKTIGENKGTSIDLTTLPAWADLKTQILNFLITDATSPLVGGVIKDF